MEDLSGENFVLIGALLLFVAVMSGKVAHRFGVPALLFFLGVGMFFGWHFIDFHSVDLTQFVGMIALCIILFTGGMGTKFASVKPVIAPGMVLATLGVACTALVLGSFIYLIAPMLGIQVSFMLALLVAATMSSTDSASVFSILQTKKCGLKENLRPLLELESGSNDPMAYILTILLVGLLTPNGDESLTAAMSGLWFVIQMVLGGLCGYLIGRLTVWVINRVNLNNNSLYSILLLAFIFFAFAFTHLVNGNGYLAVYIAGLVVGNHKLVQKRVIVVFFDGFTWLVQIVLFLTLGLFVNINELLDPQVLILSALVGGFLILVARPVAVMLCLAPFRKFTLKARLYVSWVGLRGAVPIIFATYLLLGDVEGAELLFNVVFLVTIISLVVQGTTVGLMANLMGLSEKEQTGVFGDDISDQVKSVTMEVEVNESMIHNGNMLNQIALPENTLVMMICRKGDYFVPQGNTELMLQDKLLVISDRDEELSEIYRTLGVDNVVKFE